MYHIQPQQPSNLSAYARACLKVLTEDFEQREQARQLRAWFQKDFLQVKDG